MTCDRQIDTLLLLALPASGKSEVRKYMASLTPEQCRQDFHMGHTVQLDDFPYVHLMRRIDQELSRLGVEPLYFISQEQPLRDPLEWGTLIALLNEDYADLMAGRRPEPESAARYLFKRLDAARERVGGAPKLAPLSEDVLAAVADRVEAEAAEQLADKNAEHPDTLEGKTIVLEFARGGAQGASMPLSGSMGYQYSLSVLSDEILRRSAILYVWVTPEESRRKNDARADPDDPGSILHHGVPIEVMLKEYGCDDMEHLLQESDRPGTVHVETRGQVFYLPLGRFDNRVDKTTFVREDRAVWKPGDVQALHSGLKGALDDVARGL